MQHMDGGKSPRTTFGRLIREARLAKSESQPTVSARAGICRIHLSRLENELAEPGLDVALRIIEALGIDPEYLGDIKIKGRHE